MLSALRHTIINENQQKAAKVNLCKDAWYICCSTQLSAVIGTSHLKKRKHRIHYRSTNINDNNVLKKPFAHLSLVITETHITYWAWKNWMSHLISELMNILCSKLWYTGDRRCNYLMPRNPVNTPNRKIQNKSTYGGSTIDTKAHQLCNTRLIGSN